MTLTDSLDVRAPVTATIGESALDFVFGFVFAVATAKVRMEFAYQDSLPLMLAASPYNLI